MYMKKRGFFVESHSDLKVALQRIMEMAPKYTLIAWDYPNDKITHLPKILLQSVMTQIIPYCASTEKQHIRQLQISQFPNKIYPPLSGPAIQRLILKLEKDEQDSQATSASEKSSIEGTNKNSSDMIQIRSQTDSSNFSLDQILSSTTSEASSVTTAASGKKSSIYLDKGQRASELRARSKLNKNLNLKSDVNEGNSPSEASVFFDAEQEFENSKSANHKNSQQRNDRTKKFAALFRDKSEILEKTNQSATSAAVQPVKDIIASQSSDLSGDIKNKLNTEFENFINEQIADHIQIEKNKITEDGPVLLTDLTENVKTESIFETDSLLCILINSDYWTGYIMVASEIDFYSEQLTNIVSSWFKESLPQGDLHVNLDYSFKINISAIDFIHFSALYADFYKVSENDNKKTVLSFFTIDPHFLDIQLHDEYDMIELDLHEIPVNNPLRFDIHLFLPENKKFILYCKKESAIASSQHERLNAKNVSSLYSQLENEASIQKHRAEKIINLLIQEYMTKKEK